MADQVEDSKKGCEPDDEATRSCEPLSPSKLDFEAFSLEVPIPTPQFRFFSIRCLLRRMLIKFCRNNFHELLYKMPKRRSTTSSRMTSSRAARFAFSAASVRFAPSVCVHLDDPAACPGSLDFPCSSETPSANIRRLWEVLKLRVLCAVWNLTLLHLIP